MKSSLENSRWFFCLTFTLKTYPSFDKSVQQKISTLESIPTILYGSFSVNQLLVKFLSSISPTRGSWAPAIGNRSWTSNRSKITTKRLKHPKSIRFPDDGWVQNVAKVRQLTTEKWHVRSYPDLELRQASKRIYVRGSFLSFGRLHFGSGPDILRSPA